MAMNGMSRSRRSHDRPLLWGRLSIVSYQHAFRMNASWRSEKVTQDQTSSTTRPTFKVAPLDDKVQILPNLGEQMLLESLMHRLKQQIACQYTGIGIVARKHYTFRVEDIDKIGQGYAEKYPRALKSCKSSFITISR